MFRVEYRVRFQLPSGTYETLAEASAAVRQAFPGNTITVIGDSDSSPMALCCAATEVDHSTIVARIYREQAR